MDVTPSTPNPKQTKSKPKVAAAPKKEPAKKAAVSAPVKTKKARIAPATAAPAPIEVVATAVEVVSTSALSVTDLRQQIEIAAYFLAEQRNFSPGNELDDWLQAERQVREVRTV